MGTSLDRSESQTKLTLKAASYGMPAWDVDGMDVLAVDEAARKAVESVRGGGGPHFLEFRTYRFRAHSMFDPELYRSRDEVENWRSRDPVESFKVVLMADGEIDEEAWVAMEEEVGAELDGAVAFAEAGTWEPEEELTRFVYSEVRR
jgi:TPP-dependent pyruvate/acetoin dehydrogenase alpha subunit